MNALSPQIRVFLSVAETGSITAAAEQLGMAKSSISHHLSNLEASLGVTLIHRTTRRLAFTPRGSLLLEYAQAMAAIADTALRQTAFNGEIPAGPVRFTAPHAMVANVIAPALHRLVRQYPDVQPTLIIDDQRLDILDAGLDLSITIGDLPDSDLRAQKLGTMTDVLCGPPELAEQAAQMIQDKAISAGFTLPCISHPRFEKAPNHRLQHVTTGREISITCHPTMTVNTVEAMAALVRIGAGIAVLPNLVVKEDLERGALVPVLPDFSAPSKPIYAVHPYRGTPPAAVSALISEIQSRLSFEIPNVIQL